MPGRCRNAECGSRGGLLTGQYRKRMPGSWVKCACAAASSARSAAARPWVRIRSQAPQRKGDHAYIIGEKLRSGSPQVQTALSRQGRYQDVGENMRIKQVRISDTGRFVICHNPSGGSTAHRPCLTFGGDRTSLLSQVRTPGRAVADASSR
jgi:hypothetical protein